MHFERVGRVTANKHFFKDGLLLKQIQVASNHMHIFRPRQNSCKVKKKSQAGYML